MKSHRVHAEKTAYPSAELAAELGLPVVGTGAAKMLIGRREWLALPEFGVGPFHAKTDSGARSSSLHAEDVVLADDARSVRFVTRDHHDRRIACVARVGGVSRVKSSTGESKPRIWIETEAMVPGGFRWRVRLTLADRRQMRCPMLLGRRALSGYFVIDTQGAHLLGSEEQLESEM